MRKLSEQEIERIVSLLKEGKPCGGLQVNALRYQEGIRTHLR